MLAPVVLLALLVAAPIAVPPTSNAIGAVPDEPGAFGHSTVRIGGRAFDVSPAGRFVTRVELPPWPTDVLIEVDDALGNVGRTTVTGVGWFDYRGLPWVPIVAAVVGVAALILLLRVPRLNPLPRPADDDSALEELEPD